MRIHTEEKPYAILYAQYVITHLCKLEVYGDILYQTGKKPFSCLVCYKSFPRIDCLTKHLRFHSNEKPSSKAYNQAKHLSHVTNLVQNNTGEEGWKIICFCFNYNYKYNYILKFSITIIQVQVIVIQLQLQLQLQ